VVVKSGLAGAGVAALSIPTKKRECKSFGQISQLFISIVQCGILAILARDMLVLRCSSCAAVVALQQIFGPERPFLTTALDNWKTHRYDPVG
jgi:hypothetical protein